ncbi:MAG: hypothetical protein ACYCZA_08665 [Thiobacillus sp.]
MAWRDPGTNNLHDGGRMLAYSREGARFKYIALVLQGGYHQSTSGFKPNREPAVMGNNQGDPMKNIGFIALPLLCAASVAMADNPEKEGTAVQMESATAPGMAPAHYRMARDGKRRLPHGDIRYCLDLKTSADIIRCSETRRKR